MKKSLAIGSVYFFTANEAKPSLEAALRSGLILYARRISSADEILRNEQSESERQAVFSELSSL